ncbi:MAG: diguanylate cyclase [Nitrospira sp.]|nr:diguanylate cyclase [Nitrospira sp.]
MGKTPRNLSTVERREWQLWILALALILVLGAITVGTYFFLLGETYHNFSLLRTMANRALSGLCILIMLFCAYVVTTRRILSKMRATLEYQAIRDNLTDLYDRRYFNERMEEEIARASQYRYLLAILLCDIDNFKKINKTHGHHFGDEILRSVAQTIRESTRGADLVARWGGDEIVVALANSTREGILIATERIRRSIQKIGENHHLLLDLSIGVALYPEHHTDSDELLRHAERALYIAKKGGTKIQIGEEEYKIDKHAMKIVFQPIVDTRLNRIFAYEALGRDPQGKLGILDLFKRYQTIGKLNELKCLGFELEIEKAREAGLQKLFVNMDFEMLRSLDHISKPDGIDVILEISEKEVLDNIESRLRTAQKWRARGFKFAIDDFGAGFISLPFIAQLIPDYIKIDRSTILQAVSSLQFREFLKNMMLAMKNYSAEGIIAEGIETEQELAVVKELGLDLVQGFLLGRPHELTSADCTAAPSAVTYLS